MRALQDTSLDAYYDIKPKLGEMQDRVLGVFYEAPFRQDWTNREIAAHLKLDVCHITPRIYELRSMGLVEFSRKRFCAVTQRRVLSWRLSTTIRAR